MTILITLTLAGVNTGPTFNLYSNVDSFVTPFASNVLKPAIQAGYTATAPDGTTVVRILSPGACGTSIDVSVVDPNATTTTTTTPTPPPATTTTTTTIAATTTTTTTAALPQAGAIKINDTETSSSPVTCEGTVPPSTGTVIYRTTFAILQDQFGNPIAANSDITVVLGYDFDPCTGGNPIPETWNVTIPAGQSTGSYTYTKSTLVDCGQSNCEPEYKDYTGPVSNTANLPFV